MVYTTLPQATIINVTFDILHLLVENLIQSPGTQVIFNQKQF